MFSGEWVGEGGEAVLIMAEVAFIRGVGCWLVIKLVLWLTRGVKELVNSIPRLIQSQVVCSSVEWVVIMAVLVSLSLAGSLVIMFTNIGIS